MQSKLFIYPWRILLVVHVVMRVKEFPEFPRPRSLRLNVARQKVLVWSRRKRERMVLRLAKGGTRHAYPLPTLVLEVGRSERGKR